MCQLQYCIRYNVSVALLFHSLNIASTSYLARIQIYNTKNPPLSLPPGPTTPKENTLQNVIQFLSHGWLCLELSFKDPVFRDVTPYSAKLSEGTSLSV